MRSDRNWGRPLAYNVLSLVDWEMRSDRNTMQVPNSSFISLVDWEMRSFGLHGLQLHLPCQTQFLIQHGHDTLRRQAIPKLLGFFNGGMTTRHELGGTFGF